MSKEHQLPPLVDKNSNAIHPTNKSSLQKQLSEQTSRSYTDSARERNPFLRAQTIPIASQVQRFQAKKAEERKVWHVDKVPQRPPGSLYAVLPPIGEIKSKHPKHRHKRESNGWKEIQLDEDQSRNKLYANKTRKSSRRKTHKMDVENDVSYMEDIMVTVDKTAKHRNFEAQMRYDNDDFYDDLSNDHSDHGGDFHVHSQFIEWSKELRMFLDNKYSDRRNAICTEMDANLIHVPNILRDIILCQTMDEILLW